MIFILVNLKMPTMLVDNPHILNRMIPNYITENQGAMFVWGRHFLFALQKCI